MIRLSGVALAAVAAASPARAQTATAAEAATAVVLARHGDSTRFAIGVLVRGPQFVAMPLDVVLGASTIRLRFGDGELVDVTGLIDLDDRRGFALMRARVVDRQPLTPVGAHPAAQTRVQVIGARDSMLVVVTGTIGALVVHEGVRSAPLGAELPPLHHGAPVVDAAGALIGLALRGADGAARVVPVAALLALDASRAPTPLSAFAQMRRPANAARDSGAAPGDSIVRIRLAEALRALAEYETATNLMVTLAEGWGFKNGPPRVAYELQPEFAAAKAGLAAVVERAGTQETLARTTLRMMDALAANSGDFLQAVTVGRAAGVWGPQSQALAQRGAASAGVYRDLLPIFRDQFSAALAADSLLRPLVGDELLHQWDVLPRQSTFRVGWYALIRNPFRIIHQPVETFGYELGFRGGDIILATGDEQWGPGRSVDEFKVYLARFPGQTVVVTVERDGRRIDLPVRMPRRIPSKYLYNP